MQLKITADFAPITASLNRLQLRLGDLSEPMSNIGAILEASTFERIRSTKKAPDGSDWDDLKPPPRPKSLDPDEEWQPELRKPRSLLLIELGMQGGMLSGITHVASKNSVIVGSDKHYAVYHQLGTSDMVARPFLGISADDYRDIDELLSDWLSGAFEA